jgi:hypothetical protein
LNQRRTASEGHATVDCFESATHGLRGLCYVLNKPFEHGLRGPCYVLNIPFEHGLRGPCYVLNKPFEHGLRELCYGHASGYKEV